MFHLSVQTDWGWRNLRSYHSYEEAIRSADIATLSYQRNCLVYNVEANITWTIRYYERLDPFYVEALVSKNWRKEGF
jgi:hypothetical protein